MEIYDMLMKIYDRYNNVRDKQAYHLSNEVVTVQDQSETIQSILERLARGCDTGVSRPTWARGLKHWLFVAGCAGFRRAPRGRVD